MCFRGSTNIITTQLYIELSPVSFLTGLFARLRFRYLIFYCPFVTDAPQGITKVERPYFSISRVLMLFA